MLRSMAVFAALVVLALTISSAACSSWIDWRSRSTGVSISIWHVFHADQGPRLQSWDTAVEVLISIAIAASALALACVAIGRAGPLIAFRVGAIMHALTMAACFVAVVLSAVGGKKAYDDAYPVFLAGWSLCVAAGSLAAVSGCCNLCVAALNEDGFGSDAQDSSSGLYGTGLPVPLSKPIPYERHQPAVV
mmetsp:Transcript_22789/g.44786  ORF Transcript_22789/g.44786 Transcript_22789/m.44786 type:complete len:191 (-) Transcript_22789:460-1032(-)